MNALGLLYPASNAAAVTFSPEAINCNPCSSHNCCRHFPKFIFVSSRNTR